MAAEQDGDKAKAVAIWTKLIADSPPEAPWLPTVRTRIAEASGKAPPDVAPAGRCAGAYGEAVAPCRPISSRR